MLDDLKRTLARSGSDLRAALMSGLILGMLRMRFAVSVQAIGAIRAVKFMTLASGKTEGNQDG